jgi:hypothetical protein
MNRTWLPWTVAVVSLLIAVLSVFAGRSNEAAKIDKAATAVCDPNELARLKRAALMSENDSHTLRIELDRMRGMLEQKKVSDQIRASWEPPGQTNEQRRERLGKALANLPALARQMLTGETEAYEGMREVVHAMLTAPQDDATPFLRTYETSDDPTVRRLVLPHIVARDAAGAKPFLLAELQKATDPELRADIITNIRWATDVSKDPEAQSTLLSVLQGESEPRARRAAVEMLAGVATPDAQEALVGVAASDSDPQARETAIRFLAQNPATRSRVLEVVGQEPNERLRTVDECTAKLAALQDQG